MRNKILALGLALTLLIVPLIARWFWLYAGRYEPQEIRRPDLAAIEAPAPEVAPFTDEAAAREATAQQAGTILVDRAHENRFEMGELSVLQARLAARGQQIELVETQRPASDSGSTGPGLAEQLRYARALVIVSPGKDWTTSEIGLVQAFVGKGGRLLLVTDPTRFGVILDEFGMFVGLDDDVTHLNGLAARFGLIFQADYLYNTVENESNFRNIELADFAEHPLTEGLEQVVFYAAHSIVSDEPALISAGGETRSSSSQGAGALAVAALAADGAVLALGDLTFMTEPYNAVYDNERLVANIADFLSSPQRAYGLEDFPYFFGEQVDLVYTGDPTLDSDFLAGGGGLQTLFEEEGKTLTLRESEDGTQDTLFVGLYEEAEEVEPYLAAAKVTLLVTPTRQIPAPEATSTPISIQAPTSTLGITPTAPVNAEIAITAEISPSAKHLVQIESLGQMAVTGTSLLVLQSAGERQVLVVLADTRAGLVKALELLGGGDLDGCLRGEAVTPTPSLLALCSTGEVKPGAGSGGWQESQPAEAPAPGPTPPPVAPGKPVTDTVAPPEPSGAPAGPSGTPEGRILIIAVDDGEARHDGRTSADDYAAILDNRYDLQVRSMAQDGPPDPAEVLDYDLVILTAGDYADAFGETESNLFLDLMLEGTPMILSGAYVGDGTIESVQRDIQVQETSHPLARGFTAGEVIAFVPAPSGSEVEPYVIDDIGEGEGTVIFVRGPDSEAAGTPSVFFLEDEFSDLHILFIGFPLYLLPEEAKTRLVTNAVDWMLGP